MAHISDQHYLLNEQYKNADNLNTRIELHRRFRTGKRDFYGWIFDHYTLVAGSHILELGTGPAKFWLRNLRRISDDWHITLSDFSPGMLEEARHNLSIGQHPFDFKVIDAQSIPFEDASFDTVIANHMLYHVPDRPRALSEIRRVLKPSGRFYATTISQTHMSEMDDLVRRIIPTYGTEKASTHGFNVENGQAQIEAYFPQVTRYDFDDELVVTETEPFIAYVLSGRGKALFDAEKLAALRELVEQEIVRDGAIHIHTRSGLFETFGYVESA